MRPPEPEFVTLWRNPPPTPMCCHTCEHYSEDGRCVEFGTEPPAEFAASVGACELWEEECPF